MVSSSHRVLGVLGVVVVQERTVRVDLLLQGPNDGLGNVLHAKTILGAEARNGGKQ